MLRLDAKEWTATLKFRYRLTKVRYNVGTHGGCWSRANCGTDSVAAMLAPLAVSLKLQMTAYMLYACFHVL